MLLAGNSDVTLIVLLQENMILIEVKKIKVADLLRDFLIEQRGLPITRQRGEQYD
jgi:hypothetical protein